MPLSHEDVKIGVEVGVEKKDSPPEELEGGLSEPDG